MTVFQFYLWYDCLWLTSCLMYLQLYTQIYLHTYCKQKKLCNKTKWTSKMAGKPGACQKKFCCMSCNCFFLFKDKIDAASTVKSFDAMYRFRFFFIVLHLSITRLVLELRSELFEIWKFELWPVPHFCILQFQYFSRKNIASLNYSLLNCFF